MADTDRDHALPESARGSEKKTTATRRDEWSCLDGEEKQLRPDHVKR